MSLYFRDHTNRLVRVDPLRNLPLGYLTPSPTRSTPIELHHFLVVNIESILMDQHEHILGGAQNGQHGVNREVEDHERVSNAGEVEAQNSYNEGLHESHKANTYICCSTSSASYHIKSQIGNATGFTIISWL